MGFTAAAALNVYIPETMKQPVYKESFTHSLTHLESD